MSNMTYFAEGRRLEMDAVLKKAGHTVRLGEFGVVSKLGARYGQAPAGRADHSENVRR
jgi:hypothetical protein